ncbi:MFS transporter [Streptomyces sp. NPDC091265]|uniref:MFS transporter n=1 Tax=unclassified Streptomyces TaxID=2593676 RepID=UPI0034509499
MFTTQPARWHRQAVLAALMLAAFTFNTAENLPIGLLGLISDGLRVSLSAVGYLVTGYGLTVAVASVPLAHLTRAGPRRHLLTGLLAALVVSSLVAAAAGSYWQLLAARLLTALAQALFWAVMGPVAVGLFRAEVRGHVVGALSVAGSLALVLGVPAGTWLGRQSDWTVPIAGLAGLGIVSLVMIAVLLPTSRPDEGHAAYGTRPDARRYRTVLAAGALSATGAFAGYTYVVTFLGEVSGFSEGMVSALFMAFGIACLAGVSITGVLLNRFPQAALTAAVVTQTVGMTGLFAAGAHPVAAVLFLMLMGGALGPVFMATQNEMLRCAPGRTDIALAANSGGYNVGIAAGAGIGGLLLPVVEVRGIFGVGALLTLGACAVLLVARRAPAARAVRAVRRPPGEDPAGAMAYRTAKGERK